MDRHGDSGGSDVGDVYQISPHQKSTDTSLGRTLVRQMGF